ncbi:MAG: hypothetical protein GY859_31500, partial [Desulfobacterales bacterium]|nr:hypothetical protein [Desulfobacterales bacterium]
MPRTKKIAIIAGYLARETHGLLGPQMAATIIRENTPYDCIVIGVTREDDNARVKSALADYFGGQRPMVVGFSSLSGGEKLFSLARELKQEGCLTILAGPQAGLDYVGETDWRSHPHRFRGLSDNFSLALQGPAEQIIPLLTGPGPVSPRPGPGILCPGENGEIIRTPPKAWDEAFLGRVDWGNLFILENGALAPHAVDAAQVLQQIGCPHASRRVPVEVDYPVSIDKKKRRKIRLHINGCSFCDVAVDKGFYGALAMETVLKQIEGLPETGSGAKIPFELINENPLGGLPRLLREIRDRGIRITRINLTMRADWLPPGEKRLREALALAVPMGA